MDHICTRLGQGIKILQKVLSCNENRLYYSLYAYSMKRFMDFLHQERYIDDPNDYDKLLDFNIEKITDVLEDFVYHLNMTQKPKDVTTILAGPELFFEMNRKIWHKKLVRKSISIEIESASELASNPEHARLNMEKWRDMGFDMIIHGLKARDYRRFMILR